MKVLFYSIAVCAALIFTFSCNKTSLVGSDLFVPDSINLFFKDDFDISATTVEVDSVLTFDGISSLTSLIVGELDDPIFGSTKAEAYVDLNRNSSVTPRFQYTVNGEDRKVTLDSVVLVLAYDDSGFYGDSTLVHDVDISIIEESIFDNDSLFSTYRPTGDRRMIGSKSFVPNYVDSLFIIEPGDTTATTYESQVRIQLDQAWVQQMIDDTSLISSRTNFQNYLPGLSITSSTNGSSTWGINFASGQDLPANTIRIYYTDSVPRTYDIIASVNRHNYFEHHYEGSEIEPFLGNEEKGDSLLFLQGLGGTEVEVELPLLGSDEFEDFLINQAELEFFVFEDETFNIHEAIESIILQRYDENGELRILEDAFVASEVLVEGTFDGLLKSEDINGMRVKKYSAFMTIHTIEAFETMNPSTIVRIVPRNKSLLPNRSIIYGPGHSKYPMKFKLNYSK